MVQSLHDERVGAIDLLVESLAAAGLHDRVLAATSSQLHHDPWNERLHAHRLRALAATGRRSEAGDEYRRLKRTFLAELGVEPGAVLADLTSRSSGSAPSRRPPLRWRRDPDLCPARAAGSGLDPCREGRPPQPWSASVRYRQPRQPPAPSAPPGPLGRSHATRTRGPTTASSSSGSAGSARPPSRSPPGHASATPTPTARYQARSGTRPEGLLRARHRAVFRRSAWTVVIHRIRRAHLALSQHDRPQASARRARRRDE